ncbi:glycosyl transferase [Shewanella sp. WE21]|jgi:glycosyltransferase involved in cell wall biosynthesis|uniref:glycosyltransferase family 2 protein n=1 Tax=Shewanella sp. WE21 TaxID=2029986 RepID=UPI000CF6E106|nr:glycosyltransferase family 2 protein [Shewanella sp. WE21]AVI67196.1 glycosyl transferase [Shewanella sp. WE21]
MNLQNNDKVVTVAVITYHSAATVLETLDSILNQNYGSENIELVISDDGSKDNTVYVIEEWLSRYKDKFFMVSLIRNNVNGGVAKNCNIAWKKATSKWIKTIAGDDVLTNDCISEHLLFSIKHPEARCIFSNAIVFGDSIEDTKLVTKIKRLNYIDADTQFLMLCLGNFLLAPTSFICRDLLVDIEYADPNFTLIEDYPLWLKITSHGDKLFLNSNFLVRYRKAESISQMKSKLINEKLCKQLRIIDKKYILENPKVPIIIRIIVFQDVLISKLISLIATKLLSNERTLTSLAIITIIRISSVRYLVKKFR